MKKIFCLLIVFSFILFGCNNKENNEIEELNKIIEVNNKEISELRDKNIELNNKIIDLEKENGELIKKNKDLNKEIEKYNNKKVNGNINSNNNSSSNNKTEQKVEVEKPIENTNNNDDNKSNTTNNNKEENEKIDEEIYTPFYSNGTYEVVSVSGIGNNSYDSFEGETCRIDDFVIKKIEKGNDGKINVTFDIKMTLISTLNPINKGNCSANVYFSGVDTAFSDVSWPGTDKELNIGDQLIMENVVKSFYTTATKYKININ